MSIPLWGGGELRTDEAEELLALVGSDPFAEASGGDGEKPFFDVSGRKVAKPEIFGKIGFGDGFFEGAGGLAEDEVGVGEFTIFEEEISAGDVGAGGADAGSHPVDDDWGGD